MSSDEKTMAVGLELNKSLVQALVSQIDEMSLDSILDRVFSNRVSEKKVIKIKNAFIPKFKSLFESELNELFVKVKMPQKLGELNQLKQDWSGNQEEWVPPCNAEEHCRSFRVQRSIKLKGEFDFLAQSKRDHNNQLKEKIKKALSELPPKYEALEKRKKSITEQYYQSSHFIKTAQTITSDEVQKTLI